jgi:membrane dipeptidase
MEQAAGTVADRVRRLHARGIVDMHFDVPMDLYERRERSGILASEFLPGLEQGNVGVVGMAIYLDDRYLPDAALQVALDQIARLYAEVDQCDRFVICKSYADILQARVAEKIALLITLEGVEPLGTDLDLLRVFYELGVRSIGLTHARRNAAATGGLFAPSGSPTDGLTNFGRDVVRECERLGVIIDLAHISPAAFDDVTAITSKPLIVSHTNTRRFYDIERNISDEQARIVGERHGVIGVNALLVSPTKQAATVDHYIDHLDHIAALVGFDSVAIGFDFFEFVYLQWSEIAREEFHRDFPTLHFIPGLTNHSDAANVTRRLLERGWSDDNVEKFLFRNWMRIFEELL